MKAWIAHIVDFSRRHAVVVTLFFALLASMGVWLAHGQLRVDTNTDHMFDARLPWRQHERTFDHEFPQFNNLLVAVVRGATPEETEQTAAQLVRAVRADPSHFHDAERPDANPFFRHEGLLLLPPDDLSKLLNSLIAAQPLLGSLARDPSAIGLLRGLSLMAEGVRIQHAEPQAIQERA
ncbi:hopanoid biosynthesis associated RND transporter like protein HpnN [mine drainage metagenome]|uniref:Hopanoid biosynthesis associated RND transporter like protein HpnN n=1 Tax=mine drainage metagenome TaxID=410659 RepID=T1AKA6_9ZZZZ